MGHLISFLCLCALCFCLASAETYNITQSGNVVLGGNVTLYICIPNIKRPVVWKCQNYEYECDLMCANGRDYRVSQSGNMSTLWIRRVTRRCLHWRFEDDELNYGDITLDLKDLTIAEHYKIFQNDAEAGTSLPTYAIVLSILGLVAILFIILYVIKWKSRKEYQNPPIVT